MWQATLPFLETVLTPFFHFYIRFRAFCGSRICLQSSKKTFKDHFIPNSRTFFCPMMFTCCLEGVDCPWVAEQSKSVTILWTEKGLEQISGDLSLPCWLQPPEKSSSRVIGQKRTVGAHGTMRITDSSGQMENRDLWSARSAGKKYSSVYICSKMTRGCTCTESCQNYKYASRSVAV